MEHFFWLVTPVVALWATLIVLRCMRRDIPKPYIRSFILIVYVPVTFLIRPETLEFSVQYLTTPNPALALLAPLCFAPLLFVCAHHLRWLKLEALPMPTTRHRQILLLLILPVAEELAFRMLALEWLGMWSWNGFVFCILLWCAWRLTAVPQQWLFPLLVGVLQLVLIILTMQIYSVILLQILMNLLAFLQQRKASKR